MKTTNKKLPKGRVTALQLETGGPVTAPFYDRFFCAVIPCATAKEAKAVVKLYAMTHTERFFAVKIAMEKPPHIRALCVLAALGLAEEPKSFL